MIQSAALGGIEGQPARLMASSDCAGHRRGAGPQVGLCWLLLSLGRSDALTVILSLGQSDCPPHQILIQIDKISLKYFFLKTDLLLICWMLQSLLIIFAANHK